MKTVLSYEHKCKRCQHVWVSRMKQPKACAKCKSAYWDVKPKQKEQAAA